MACQFRVGNGIFLNFTGWPKKNLTETSKKYYDHQKCANVYNIEIGN